MKLIWLSNYSAELWPQRERILRSPNWCPSHLYLELLAGSQRRERDNMDCFYQANQRIRPPSYFNTSPIMYGYGVPSYYSPPFFPLGRNSQVRRPPVASASPPLNVPNPVTALESSTSPVSVVSQTPPDSPSESSTDTHESIELNDEACQSAKDASESEEKTGEGKLYLVVKKTLRKAQRV